MIVEMPKLMRVLQEGMESGLHIGAQVFAAVDGEPVMDAAVGLSRLAGNSTEGRDVAMGNETLMVWLSAGKPVTAAAVMMLVERGKLSLDDAVARVIPDFGSHGKEVITLRHLLTHTAGIRGVDASYPFASWEETLGRIYEMRIEKEWVPGERAGYHTHTSWYLLGEMINRVTGMDHAGWIRENLFLPLGMKDTFLAMEGERYRAYGERLGFLYDTAVTPAVPMKNYDTELGAGRSRPSGSCRGPVRELARFYEMLRCGGILEGVRVMREETVAAMISRQRVGMLDQTFRQKIDWGLGVILNSSHHGPGIPYQFGAGASRETFGHGGSQSSTGFCDPERKLVVGMVFNGCPGEAAHDRRLRAALKAMYEDLGF